MWLIRSSCLAFLFNISLCLCRHRKLRQVAQAKNCLHLSRIPVQHFVLLILPQETSPSCASKKLFALVSYSCSVLLHFLFSAVQNLGLMPLFIGYESASEGLILAGFYIKRIEQANACSISLLLSAKILISLCSNDLKVG